MISPRPTAAWGYIRRIKNPSKRKYAEAYLDYCDGNGAEPDDAGISYMAAQAVRMQLAELGVSPAEPCQYAAGCENRATTTIAHPIFGDLPVCKWCADFYRRMGER